MLGSELKGSERATGVPIDHHRSIKDTVDDSSRIEIRPNGFGRCRSDNSPIASTACRSEDPFAVRLFFLTEGTYQVPVPEK